MKVDQKICERLDKLITEGEALLKKVHGGPKSGPGWASLSAYTVDSMRAHQWGISCLSLLGRTLGQTSDHYLQFQEQYKKIAEHSRARNALGILKAAKDDYANDSLFETRTLITAEVFDDFLEQAQYLLDAGYEGPAAVIAGCVLEDGLRSLCGRKSVALTDRSKLDKMNADLAKAGAYDVLTQKRITLLADLRNKAAHGKWTEFAMADITGMITDVRRFLEDYLV